MSPTRSLLALSKRLRRRYVVAQSEKAEAKRVYDAVRKGSGQVDTLNDNVAMVSFARTYPELVAEVHPGGTVIDESLLARVESEALALLKLRGQVMTAEDETTQTVDRQNRLITLCVLAEREIKRFADAAFYDDTDRYNRDYASQFRRGGSKGSSGEPPVDTAPNVG